MSRFYEYRQNNSGGSFIIDEDRGLSVEVIVEADSVADADRRAESIGLYWKGCRDGRDCTCCGDRWSQFWGWGDGADGDPVPSIYQRPLIDFPDPNDRLGPIRWAGDQPHVFVHVKDGRFYGFILTEAGQFVYDGQAGAIPEALPSSVKEIENDARS